MVTMFVNLVSFGLLIITGLVSSQSETVEFSSSADFWTSPHNTGGTVTMTCSATPYAGTIGQHIQIIKTIYPSDGSAPVEVDIATNMQVGLEYKDLKNTNNQSRYTVFQEVLQGPPMVGQLTLNITELTGTDAGNYSCRAVYKPNITKTSTIKTLHVQEKLSTVKWFRRESNGNMTDVSGGAVTMYPQWAEHLVCQATAQRALVQPQFIISYDENNNKTDVTSWFQRDDPQDKVVKVAGKAYTYDYTTVRSYSYVSTVPDGRLNARLLRCDVTSPGLSMVHNANVTVNVMYSPTITCDEKTYYAKVGKEATFNCTAKGNPRPLIVIAVGGDQVMSNITATVNPYENDAFKVTKKETSDSLTFSITKKKIEKGDFGSVMAYALNTYGNSTVLNLQLKEGVEPGSSTAAALHSTLLALLICVLHKSL